MKKHKNNPKKTKQSKHASETNLPARISDRRLVVSMIKDDLVNYRLLTGLYNLGLVTELYFLNISQTVFEYMGIPSDMHKDRHYEKYAEMKEEVMQLDFTEGREKLNALAERIYQELVTMQFMKKF